MLRYSTNETSQFNYTVDLHNYDLIQYMYCLIWEKLSMRSFSDQN